MLGAGAIVRFPCGGFDHVGLVTDEGTLLHSSKQRGLVTEEPIAKWMNWPGLKVERYVDWYTLQRAKLLGRSKLGQRWTLLENCEHFVSEITTGAKNSPQLQVAGVVAALVVLALAVTSS